MSRTSIGVGVAVISYILIATSPWTRSEPQAPAEVAVVGKATGSDLRENDERWSAAYGATGPAGPVVSLPWGRGLSSEYSEAKGIVQFDLEKGTVSVRVGGL